MEIKATQGYNGRLGNPESRQIKATRVLTKHLALKWVQREIQVRPCLVQERGQATLNEFLEVNLGTKEEPHPTFININMSPIKKTNIYLLC